MGNEVPEVVNQMMQSLINLVAYLVPIILVAVIPRAISVAKREWENIKHQQPEWLQKAIEDAALHGATFAEQIDLAGLLSDYAGSKKEAAILAADKWLRQQGYDVNVDVIANAIESVLFKNPDLFN